MAGTGMSTHGALSGGLARDVDDLELDAVRVVEEDGVVPELVAIFFGPALDRRALLAQPARALVDDGPRPRLEAEMVQPRLVAVDRALSLALGLAQADSGPGPAEVPDRLPPLTLDLADPVPAERPEQVAVERQAALDRRDDQIDEIGRAHV